MNINEMYPSKYVKGQDLQGKAHTLTIARLASEKMSPRPGTPPADKWVIYFTETDKGIILNRTNAETIALLYGDTNNWTGKRITIYPESVTIAGKAQIAIRMRAPKGQPAPQHVPPATTPPDEDD